MFYQTKPVWLWHLSLWWEMETWCICHLKHTIEGLCVYTVIQILMVKKVLQENSFSHMKHHVRQLLELLYNTEMKVEDLG